MTELTDQIETVAGVLETADVESDVSDDEIRSLLRAYLDKSVPASEAQSVVPITSADSYDCLG